MTSNLLGDPTDKAIQQLINHIVIAWETNIKTIYPEDDEGPDPKIQAEVAARAAWAYFLNLIDSARKK